MEQIEVGTFGVNAYIQMKPSQRKASCTEETTETVKVEIQAKFIRRFWKSGLDSQYCSLRTATGGCM